VTRCRAERAAEALDKRGRRALEMAVRAGWCSGRSGRAGDEAVMAAHFLRCVAERRVEVYALFVDDDAANVGVTSAPLLPAHDPAWAVRVANALRPHAACGGRLLALRDGATIYGALARDVERIIDALLPLARTFGVECP